MSGSLKSRFSALSTEKKIQLVAAVILTVVLLVTLPVYAWFSSQRKLLNAAKITAPSPLTIGAGLNDDITMLDLSKIDVEENKSGKMYYVFSVIHDSFVQSYRLQLAHTTNNPFIYRIYPAEITDETPPTGTIYVNYPSTENVREIYKAVGNEVIGGYIDQNGDNLFDGNDYFSFSYDDYSKVQENAKPIYWQANDLPPQNLNSETTTEGLTADFYILEVSWLEYNNANPSNPLKNDKETDIVYITVEGIRRQAKP